MFCKKCGKEIKGNMKFCPGCGIEVSRVVDTGNSNSTSVISMSVNDQTQRQGGGQKSSVAVRPDDFAPVMSVWSYLGLFILSAIPVIGIILIIVFAIDSSNKNKSNYCRAMILMWVISVLFVIIFKSAIIGLLYSLM